MKQTNRGRGHVQLGIMNALQAEPDKWFTVPELAKVVYPHRDSFGEAQFNAIYRTLKDLPIKRRTFANWQKGRRPIKVQLGKTDYCDPALKLAALAVLDAIKAKAEA